MFDLKSTVGYRDIERDIEIDKERRTSLATVFIERICLQSRTSRGSVLPLSVLLLSVLPSSPPFSVRHATTTSVSWTRSSLRTTARRSSITLKGSVHSEPQCELRCQVPVSGLSGTVNMFIYLQCECEFRYAECDNNILFSSPYLEHLRDLAGLRAAAKPRKGARLCFEGIHYTAGSFTE